MRRLAIALGVALALSACAQPIDVRGNEVDLDAVATILPGTFTKEDVRLMLGPPTTLATFTDKTWYYISRRTETIAFLKPITVDQMVVTVVFDDRNIVSDIKLVGMESHQEVAHVSRTTPTSGHSFSLLEQLFGNIGRFGGDKQIYSNSGTSR